MMRRKRKLHIPNPHGKEIGIALLREILRHADIGDDEWNKA
jgi:hypothetical protein